MCTIDISVSGPMRGEVAAAASTSHFLEQSYGMRGRFPAYPAPCGWPFSAPRSQQLLSHSGVGPFGDPY